MPLEVAACQQLVPADEETDKGPLQGAQHASECPSMAWASGRGKHGLCTGDEKLLEKLLRQVGDELSVWENMNFWWGEQGGALITSVPDWGRPLLACSHWGLKSGSGFYHS